MRCGIALGSNAGDRAAHLRAGWRALQALHCGEGQARVSAMYETDPVGCAPGDASFLNAVAEIGFAGDARCLLRALQAVEAALGRPAVREKNAPRPLDLDLLYCGREVVCESGLELPHPRMRERRFVLVPLAEVRERMPGTGESVAALAAALPEVPRVQRVEHSWV